MSKLPEMCYSVREITGELIAIKREERGYALCKGSDSMSINRDIANWANTIMKVTKAQEAAMVAGAMFGWDVPAADPDNYDENGKPITKED